jgi:hypothetical protein
MVVGPAWLLGHARQMGTGGAWYPLPLALGKPAIHDGPSVEHH